MIKKKIPGAYSLGDFCVLCCFRELFRNLYPFDSETSLAVAFDKVESFGAFGEGFEGETAVTNLSKGYYGVIIGADVAAYQFADALAVDK